MNKVSKIVTFLLFNCLIQGFAQDIAIGQWRDHLAFNQGTSLAKAENLVYCISNGNLFTYNVNDNSIERATKVKGFSDISAVKVAYNEKAKAVVIAYANTNIDVVKGEKIINISDIKTKQIFGNKVINNIYMEEHFAYLSCGFGVVVIDLDKLEIKDTYNIGVNGVSIDVKDFTSDETYYYACTVNGVFKATKSNQFLSDFSSWVNESGLPNTKFNAITFYNNKIYTNQEVEPFNGRIWQLDLSTNQWSWVDSAIDYKCYNLRTNDGKLVVNYANGVVIYDGDFQYNDYKGGYEKCDPHDAIFKNGSVYMADFNNSLVISPLFKVEFEFIKPQGPVSNKVFDMDIVNSHLWVVPGDLDGWSNLFNIEGISHFYKNEWHVIAGDSLNQAYGIFDLINVCVDPKDDNRVFCSSWSKGLLQLNGNKVANYFDNNNSTLDTIAGAPFIYVGGSAIDNDGNIWVSNSYSTSSICVYDNKLKKWDDIVTQNIIGNTRISKITINSLNQKWFILPEGGGLMVFDDNGTINVKTDDKLKKLGFTAGTGAITGADALAVAEDLNGAMWVGTDKGICVFYTPSTIFDDSGFDAQQIKIEQGGYVEYLLESEIVKTIAIDGANRKWIGTANSGLYLINADGTKQLEHFTIDNSPLLSNTINDLEIDGETGELFIATSSGIISYKYTATDAKEDYDSVYAYPNPVKPDYEGLIAIKGLVRDCDVKITDTSGRLIYTTKALGGQAVWDGKNFEGRKAQTGVYIVFLTNPDGSKTETTKIFLAN
jgi:sugar lactone lactonase YvrE